MKRSPKLPAHPPMKQGVVAVLDALGFKGIWRRHDPASVLARLKLAERGEGMFGHQGYDGEIQFLSDTVVMTCGIQAEHSGLDCLLYVSMRVAYFQSTMLDFAGPHLAYRGAITSGQFLADGNFVIGPAIDEAVEAEKLARGPFVWLTPSARALLPATVDASYLQRRNAGDGTFYLMPYDVPLTENRVVSTFVVPPAVTIAGTEDTAQRLRRALTDCPDAEKVANCEKLLAALASEYQGWRSR